MQQYNQYQRTHPIWLVTATREKRSRTEQLRVIFGTEERQILFGTKSSPVLVPKLFPGSVLIFALLKTLPGKIVTTPKRDIMKLLTTCHQCLICPRNRAFFVFTSKNNFRAVVPVKFHFELSQLSGTVIRLAYWDFAHTDLKGGINPTLKYLRAYGIDRVDGLWIAPRFTSWLVPSRLGWKKSRFRIFLT